MLDFQRYQIEFTAHIRDPKIAKKPAKVADARMAVYREIVFNNIFGSVSACFPVCQQILGKRAWLKLTKQFFAQHQASTPIFREIPQEFLKFIAEVEGLPAYFQQLAHYEWVELAVNSQKTEMPRISKKSDFLHETPVLAPAHMLLEYDFPVHKISAKFKPKDLKSENRGETYLLVFRNAEFKVKFIELNVVTFELLKGMQSSHLPGEQALARLAEALPALDSKTVLNFGLQTLQDLANQGAIIGSQKIAKKHTMMEKSSPFGRSISH